MDTVKRRIPSPWLGRGATDDDLDRYWRDDLGPCPVCGTNDCERDCAEPDWEQMIADKEQADE